MEKFNHILRRVIRWGSALAGIALVVAMLIVVVSVVSRFFDIAVAGSMELMQLIMAIVIAAALAYAGLRKGHVVVKIIVSRLPVKGGSAFGIAMAFLSLVIWGLMCWAAVKFVLEIGLEEVSETLEIPYMPFRILFILGLLLFSLTYILEIFEEIQKARGK